MSKKFTLANIRAAADKKFGHTEIDGVILLNPLRLSEEKRAEMTALFAELRSEAEDKRSQQAVLEDVLLTVAKTEASGKKLVKEIGGDLAVLLEVIASYSQETEAGEASASQD
jgi:hypothetical protein